MKPPFSYYGGKQKLASKLIPLIPKHTVYCEPFAGGVALLFRKPWPKVRDKRYYREIINDTNEHLTNFFIQLRDNGEELCRRLSLTLYDQKEYQRAKELDCEDKLEAARRFFVNVQQGFGNIINSGWGRGVFGSNLAVMYMNSVDRLPEYISRMRSIHISCTDALKCIHYWDSPQTFFYCDPPYPGTSQGHYEGYSLDDFHELVDTLDKAQGSFLLSCYDTEGMQIPDGWERFKFKRYCSVSGKGKVNADRTRKVTKEELGNRNRVEVVYRRGSKVPPREEIQKLYDSGKFDCFVNVGYSSGKRRDLFTDEGLLRK